MTVFSHQVAAYRIALDELNVWLREFPGTPTTQFIQYYAVIAPPKEFTSWQTMPYGASFDTATYTVQRLTWNDLCLLKEPERDWEGVMQVLSHCKGTMPTVQAYCFYARALWGQRDYAEAESELHDALTLDPTSAFAMQLLGETHFYQHDYDGAVEWLTNSIAANPQCGRTYYGRGLAREKVASTLDIDVRGFYYKHALQDYSSAYLLLPQKQFLIGPAMNRAQRLFEEFSI